MSMDARELLASGYIAQPDALAEIRETVDDPHSGRGGRALRITMAGGLSVEVLPDRGLDLGCLWFAGQPIAWRSALGPRGAHADPAGAGWIGRFGGGMLATCGMDNIGPERDGMGLHGSHHATPAQDVAVRRQPDASVVVEGVIDSSAVFGRRVHVERRIEIAAGQPRLQVRDVVVNDGPTVAAAPVLYHLNFGAPLLMPGTEVKLSAGRRTPRDYMSSTFDWHHFPGATNDVVEAVWEHTDLDTVNKVVRAQILSPAPDLTASVEWHVDELPRCIEWIYPTRGGWALGVEPTNAPLFGPDRTGEHAGAPLLEPGERRSSGFTLQLAP
jgi:hypothetical protein